MPDFSEGKPQAPELPNIHLGLIDGLPKYLAATLGDRQSTLSRFAENPTDPAIWSLVARQALGEEARNTGQPKELRDIPTTELVAFASLVRRAEHSERYGLTASYAPNGKRWFDVLYGFHSPAGDDAITAAVSLVTYGRERIAVDNALDIATGIGKTARIISQYALHTFGLDNNMALLTVAHTDNPAIRFVSGSVDSLPFPNRSMDIITSDGIKYTLPAQTSRAMYREVARVLRRGGVYIDTHYAAADEITVNTGRGFDHPDYHPEDLKTFVTWKAVLQDMIVDTVSGKWDVDTHQALWGDGWDQFIRDLGLREEQLYVDSLTQIKYSHARLLHKQ